MTYDDYVDGGGGLSKDEFLKFGSNAEMIINAQTFGRIANADITERLKKCFKEVVDLISKKSAVLGGMDGKLVQSQSNDGVSTTYLRASFAESCTITDNQIKDVIRTYLMFEKDRDGTPLLYKGVGV